MIVITNHHGPRACFLRQKHSFHKWKFKRLKRRGYR